MDTLSKYHRAITLAHPCALEVTVTCFQPDEKKSGGAYVTVTGSVKKIDAQRRLLILQKETTIHINDLIDIQELK